ncbi:ABC transporter C-terminal domain-containing protein [Sphingomonas mali]|uniref:ABC transporter C-terminal domain-containing protein n=1 Tax=Sphingomonas mali TaxID=40682 RepID=UPI000832667A|nr:ABC transporter C-terminal domain-containing protein [Sphingomonas mali]
MRHCIFLFLASTALVPLACQPAVAQSSTSAQENALEAKIEALNARIAALEAQLAPQQGEPSRAQPLSIATSSAAPTIPTAASAPAANRRKLTVSFSGFFEAATIYRSHNVAADIASNYARIPFANDRAAHTGEMRFSGRQSRLGILVSGDVDTKTHGFIFGDFDLQGAAVNANSVQANGYNPRLRQLYIQLHLDRPGLDIMAGQAWSLITPNATGIALRSEVVPPSIDAQFIPGYAWARQPQIRVTKRITPELWGAISLENPQTVSAVPFLPGGVTLSNSQAPTSGFGTNSYSLNKYPDVIGKLAWDGRPHGRSFHIEAIAVLRAANARATVTSAPGSQAQLLGLVPGSSNTVSWMAGGGGNLSVQLIPKRLDLYGSLLFGNGIGRYGTTGMPDVTVRPDGRLVGLPATMWLAGATLHLTTRFDLYGFMGKETVRGRVFRSAALPSADFGYGVLGQIDNSGCTIEGGACAALTRSIEQVALGGWFKAFKGDFGRVQFGVEYSTTLRRTFADGAGVAPRGAQQTVLTSIRYLPF